MIHDDGDESLLVLARLKLNENTSSHVQQPALCSAAEQDGMSNNDNARVT